MGLLGYAKGKNIKNVYDRCKKLVKKKIKMHLLCY